MPSIRSARAPTSSLRSPCRHSGTFSPIKSLLSICRLGRPSRNRMRSIRWSAWCISSIDSSYSCLPSLVRPQFLYMRAWRKYWLTAVSSLTSSLLSNWMTFASPFIVGSLSGGRQGGGFAVRGVVVMTPAFAEQLVGTAGATAAFAGHAQFALQLRQGVAPGLHRGADVAVGNGFADADIHSGLEGREGEIENARSLLRSILNKIPRSVNSASVGRPVFPRRAAQAVSVSSSGVVIAARAVDSTRLAATGPSMVWNWRD